MGHSHHLGIGLALAAALAGGCGKKKKDIKALCEDVFAHAEKDDGKWSPGKGDKAAFMAYCLQQKPEIVRCSSMTIDFDDKSCKEITGVMAADHTGFDVKMKLGAMRDGRDTGAPSGDATPASGTPAPTAAQPVGAAGGGGGKQEYTATWDGTTVGPTKFDRQVWSDDGNGNLQIFLFANCPSAPQDCSVLKYDQINQAALKAVCPDFTVIHIPFGPAGQQTGGMGPLALEPGKYGGKTEKFHAGMVEHGNADYKMSNQIYGDVPDVDITQVGADGIIAGSFDSTDPRQAGRHFTGAFSAQKCVCEKGTGECK